MVNNGEQFDPHQEKEWQLYKLWKSLPKVLKGKAYEEVAQAGLGDELIAELLSLKFQSDFSKKYKVSQNTLSRWNAMIQKEGLSSELGQWSKELTADILFSLANTAKSKGTAAEVKLWFELVEGFKPAQTLQLKTEDESTIKENLIKYGLIPASAEPM